MERGFLLVLSGPSGVGKGRVCDALRQTDADILYSISATTRPIRGGEVDGQNYFFLSEEQFLERIEEDAFLEHAHVHGNRYGTPKDFVLRNIDSGKIVILEIDVQGALQVKRNFPNGVFVFLLPPSMKELKRRITDRGTESEQQISLRMNNAREEMGFIEEYDYAVINDDLDRAVESVLSIIAAERLRVIDGRALIDYLEEEVHD
ncbi:MAG: guanylate kinase [Tissierellia bacterium]|nr:guanylate kinase [Tissierellia bacterium]